VDFALTEEQRQIRESARGFLDVNARSARLRTTIASAEGYDAALWQQMTRELGWASIAVQESYGGLGLGMIELAILQQELGRRLLPSPFFSTSCLAVPIFEQAATETQKKEWLPRIVREGLRVAVALGAGPTGTGTPTAALVRRQPQGAWILTGSSEFVIFGHVSDILLVAACESGDADSLRWITVSPAADGVRVHPHLMLDTTRPMSRVEFHDVRIAEQAVLGTTDRPTDVIAMALDRARVALAAEALGGAEYVLEMTTQYVKERVQFDRPIGSFQAIKHRLADMMVLVEAAKSTCWYAACVAEESPSELPEAASIAKSTCCDAFVECSSSAIQLHGGIGFSWEHDAHLYFKRARAIATLLGSSNWQRERIAVGLGLGESAFAPTY